MAFLIHECIPLNLRLRVRANSDFTAKKMPGMRSLDEILLTRENDTIDAPRIGNHSWTSNIYSILEFSVMRMASSVRQMCKVFRQKIADFRGVEHPNERVGGRIINIYR